MDTLTAGQARGIADRFLKLLCGGDTDVVILDAATREETFGWVFFYDSREYLETGDVSAMMAGNGPLIVDRTGRVHQMGTVLLPGEYIEGFRTLQETR